MGPHVRGERSLETNFASAGLDIMSVSLHLFTLLRYKVHHIIFFSSYVRRRNRYLFSLLYTDQKQRSRVAEPRVDRLMSLSGVLEPAAARGLVGIRVRAQPVGLASQQLVLMSTSLAFLSCSLPSPAHLLVSLKIPLFTTVPSLSLSLSGHSR